MSGTSPKDQTALLASAKPAPRMPAPGERAWALQKDAGMMHADIRDNGAAGAELQVFSRGEFIFGRRYETRGIALDEAAGLRQQLEAEGWKDAG